MIDEIIRGSIIRHQPSIIIQGAMCWIVLFIVALILVRRLPVIRRTQPVEFRSYDPDSFARWQRKSAGAIYVFLGFAVGVSIGLLVLSQSAAPELSVGVVLPEVTYWMLGITILFLLGLSWSVVLAVQATLLKLKMRREPLPPSHYPRPGQEPPEA
jgi:hypothetical protein